ncbi:MAG: C10 family peptidase, partial [Verrucomicrobiota bacterium]|nr:C10 family peptidase [Verrucomicrobiota bacterium]
MRTAALVFLFGISAASAAPRSKTEALDAAAAWMPGHPVMGVAAGRAVASFARFPEAGGESAVYIVSLAPRGYLVLHADDRLPLVAAFSADTAVNLDDRPDNAFRAMLAAYAAGLPQKLAALPEPSAAVRAALAASPYAAAQSVETFGPFLETSWTQWHPYNLYCPAGGSMNGYQGRVPTGCVPVTWAQVLAYHRWPIHGAGTHAYTDPLGSVTGAHFADFSGPINWGIMQNTYSASASPVQPGETDIGALFYKLAVAANANFEETGTSASIATLGSRVAEHLFFEPSSELSVSNPTLPGALNADLRAGFPCIIGIPGHAVVADGLLTDGVTDTYHINYGWAGENDGWWTAGSIAGSPMQYGDISIRPRLMAFPLASAVTASGEGAPVTLEWVLPRRREQEAQKILIQRMAGQTAPWTHSAATLDGTEPGNWTVTPGGRTGSGWFSSYNNASSLTLSDVFIPDADTAFTFWAKIKVSSTFYFDVAVSTNPATGFETVYTANNVSEDSFSQHTLPLGGYAGERVRIRFSHHHNPNWSSSGADGVWLDDLALVGGTWAAWADFAEDTALNAHRFLQTTTLLDDCANFTTFFQPEAPGAGTWQISTSDGVPNCAYLDVRGFVTRMLRSITPVTPGPSSRLVLRWKRNLASPMGVEVSTSGTGGWTEIASFNGRASWQTESIPLAAYAGQAVYIRLNYVTGSTYPNDGGIWIDSLSLQTVTNAEYEEQPVHYTGLAAPAAGTHVLRAIIVDTAGTAHVAGPDFTLTVPSPFTFAATPGGTAALVSYSGSATKLTVPATWEGRPVTAVATGAFAGAAGLTSVTLPASVASLADGAFSGAVALQSVYFLGDAPAATPAAFAGCGA